jgi:hypothetical protein
VGILPLLDASWSFGEDGGGVSWLFKTSLIVKPSGRTSVGGDRTGDGAFGCSFETSVVGSVAFSCGRGSVGMPFVFGWESSAETVPLPFVMVFSSIRILSSHSPLSISSISFRIATYLLSSSSIARTI